MAGPRFVGGDTMNFWIEGTLNELRETIKDWDFILINDGEARLLSGEYNLRRAAKAIQAMGPKTVVIKRGEYGAVLFRPEGYFVAPGFLLDNVFDPTGAGDCFAGGFMGYLTEQGVTDLGHATHPHLRKAMIYGSVMGSYCCEQFGVGRLRTLTRDDIEKRFEEFRKFTEFYGRMKTLPFTKAEAVGNDFLVVEWSSLQRTGVKTDDLPDLAIKSCHRQFGVGADGVEVVFPARHAEEDYSLRIFNSDGSEAEISGNGTRCAAAFLMRDAEPGATLRIGTVAGVKTVRMQDREGVRFDLEMSMGLPTWKEGEVGSELEIGGWPREVAILDVGNPQCALFVEHFEWDWRSLGARRSSSIRSFPTAPTSRSCAVSTNTPSTCASGSAAPARR